MDAIDEGEKDIRLYELICKSLLSEKDFKKVIDKCRYDEENDEWIIPFLKKKNVDHLDNYSTLPKLNNNNSMLPDINNGGNSQGGYRPDMGSTMALPKFGGNGTSNGSLSARDGGKGSYGKEKERTSPSIVPLLTLPGGTTTAASLMMMSPPTSAPHTQKHPKSDNYSMPSLSSSRQQQQQYDDISGAESGRGGGSGIGYLDPVADKKKKNKNKMPKMPNANKNSEGSGGGGGTAAASQNYHMPKIGGGGGGGGGSGGYGQNSSRGEGATYSSGEAQIDEAGTGETAGPLNEWGFEDYLGAGSGSGGPEDGTVEYSDDEDFEADAKVSGPYPPSGGQAKGDGNPKHRHKKKKHKKHNNYEEDSGPQQQSSPRAQLTLPKI